MDADSSGKLGFHELSHEDGIDEIDAFYPRGSPERRTKAMDEREATSSEDNERMEDVEPTHHSETSAESASRSTRHSNHDTLALNPYDKVTPPQISDGAGPSQLAQAQTVSPSKSSMEPVSRGDSAAALNRSPVPPSSSNRGELQAEMRHEEEDQPIQISNLVPLPFSLSSKDKKSSVAGKRETPFSPLAAKQRARKKAKTGGEEEIVPSSPPIFVSSPSKATATHKPVPSDPAHDISQVLATSEQNLQRNPFPRDDRPTQHASDAPPGPETKQKDTEISRVTSLNPAKRNINATAASKLPLPKHRRPMGSGEKRDLIGIDVLKGVHATSGSQRVTRNQKRTREAAKPGASAKEAVKKRRQSGVQDAK